MQREKKKEMRIKLCTFLVVMALNKRKSGRDKLFKNGGATT